MKLKDNYARAGIGRFTNRLFNSFLLVSGLMLLPSTARAVTGDCSGELEEKMRQYRAIYRKVALETPLDDCPVTANVATNESGYGSVLKLGDTLIYSPLPVSSCSVSLTGIKNAVDTFDLPRLARITPEGVEIALSLAGHNARTANDDVKIPFGTEARVGCDCLVVDGSYLIGVRRIIFLVPTEKERKLGEIRTR